MSDLYLDSVKRGLLPPTFPWASLLALLQMQGQPRYFPGEEIANE